MTHCFRRRVLVAGVLLVAAVAAACGTDDASAPVPPVDTTVAAPITVRTPAVDGGMPVGAGGLSVAEALATDAENPLAVHGYVWGRGDDVRLCTALSVTSPPTCEEPSMQVRGIDLVTMSSTLHDGGTTWTNGEVSLLGDRVDGELQVSGTVQ